MRQLGILLTMSPAHWLLNFAARISHVIIMQSKADFDQWQLTGTGFTPTASELQERTFGEPDAPLCVCVVCE